MRIRVPAFVIEQLGRELKAARGREIGGVLVAERLGGDEFVIVFAGVDEILAEQAWERIVAAFDAINQTENRPYVVSVSHGIQEINCGVDRMLDSILQQADEKMYEEKRKIKSSIRILRQK